MAERLQRRKTENILKTGAEMVRDDESRLPAANSRRTAQGWSE